MRNRAYYHCHKLYRVFEGWNIQGMPAPTKNIINGYTKVLESFLIDSWVIYRPCSSSSESKIDDKNVNII